MWRMGALTRGMRRWEEVARDSKRLVQAARKVVLRWVHGTLGSAMSRWTEQATEQRRLALAGDRVLTRWRRKDLAAAWGGLLERVAESRRSVTVGSRVVQFWTNQVQGRSFRTWTLHVHEILRLRRVMEKVVGRMRHRGVSAMFSRWGEVVVRRREGREKRSIEGRIGEMQEVAAEMLREFEATKEEVVLRAAQAIEAERHGHRRETASNVERMFEAERAGHREVQRETASSVEGRMREMASNVEMAEIQHDLHVRRITARVLGRMQHRAASMALDGWR
ncbi:hypothetical protein T484DRAFT_1800658, partial [Baffinella frigidus]